jgi:hypothetical protein
MNLVPRSKSEARTTTYQSQVGESKRIAELDMSIGKSIRGGPFSMRAQENNII